MLILRFVILLAVFVWLAGCAVNRQMFPRRRTYDTLSGLLKLPVGNGIEVAMLHFDNPDSKHTVLFNHGNYEDLGTLENFLADYSRKGFSVVCWDYRGYGASNGKPTEVDVCKDVQTVFDYIVNEFGVAPENIIVHGRSIGSGPACDVAINNKVGGLIIEAGFMSVFSTVLPWPGMPGDKFVNINKIGKVDCPVLIMHGMQDGTISFKHGQKLYEKAIEPKYCHWFDDAGHNDMLYYESEYWRAIKDFKTQITAE